MSKIAKLKKRIEYLYDNDYYIEKEYDVTNYYLSQDIKYQKKYYKYIKFMIDKSELTHDINLQEILSSFIFTDYRRFKK